MSDKDYDLLSYKPVLKSDKEINTTIVTEITLKEQIKEQVPYSSTAYDLMIENTSSAVIDSIELLISSINTYIEIMSSNLQGIIVEGKTFNDFTNALVSGDASITEPYLEFHRANVLGETGVEVYEKVYKLKLETNDLKALTSSIIYGDAGITYEDALAVEQLKFNKILEYENSGKENLINYATVVTDTMINYVLQNHVDVLSQYANGLFAITIATNTGDKVEVKPDTIVTMEKFFKDSAFGNLNDINKLDSVLLSNTVDESIKTSFIKRREIVNAMNLQNDLEQLPNPIYVGIVKDKIDAAIENSFAKILDFNKSVEQSCMYRNDYVATLRQKNDIRRIYKTFK